MTRTSQSAAADAVAEAYTARYGGEPFVHYVEEPSIRAVVGSNHAHVATAVVGRKAVAFGAIDNLVNHFLLDFASLLLQTFN